MIRRQFSRIVGTLLLAFVLIATTNFRVRAQASGPIYIRENGSIDPPTSPISSVDNITYTLTDNIGSDTDALIIERDDIVVDGAGYTLQGTESGAGVSLSGVTNATIKNLQINAFYDGIYLWSSKHNTISGINITGNTEYGIYLDIASSYNNISQNSVTSNAIDGIFLYYSPYNTVFGNTISYNDAGVTISTNSPGNTFFHNNFIGNTEEVYVSDIAAWDAGYPLGGNYWSGYTGSDLNGGPYQNETGSDGIGDTSYGLDQNNVDHYPLISPLVHDVGITAVSPSKSIVGQGYSMTVGVQAINYGKQPESFNLAVRANSTTINTQTTGLEAGASGTATCPWNTSKVAKGNYTIGAYVPPVQGETHTADNNFTDGTIYVGVPGDVDGNHKVNVVDLLMVAKAYGTNLQSSNWNPNMDVDCNNKVDVIDILITAKNYGKTDP
jgi:parallel beta-helix repeat protein